MDVQLMLASIPVAGMLIGVLAFILSRFDVKGKTIVKLSIVIVIVLIFLGIFGVYLPSFGEFWELILGAIKWIREAILSETEGT